MAGEMAGAPAGATLVIGAAQGERPAGRVRRGGRGIWVAGAFALVLIAQLALVAGAGTDIPWNEQWDVEGRWAYPRWFDGSWRFGDLFRAHNEHRIAWTHGLDLALLALNGQWDPLVQLVAGACLRALGAAGLVWVLARRGGTAVPLAVAAGVVFAFLPHLAWHNVLWGFQTQVYFALLFSLAALALLGVPDPPGKRQLAGLALGGAGLLAMGAAALVPVALLGLVVVRVAEERRFTAARWREAWPALLLLLAALALRVEVPEHAGLAAATPAQFITAFCRALAWPHTGQPAAALVLNAPLVWLVIARLTRRRPAPVAGEDFVLVLGGWVVVMAGAMAWTRGGSPEFSQAVPSRYVDFLVLLPIVNAWCAVAWLHSLSGRSLRLGRVMAGAWGVFLLIGWLGLSAQTMKGIILPRLRDRDAPVRLAVAFQRSGDASILAGQPALLVPHSNPESVRTVLEDSRMRGRLPPSLQPERPLGPWSRAVRWLLRRQ